MFSRKFFVGILVITNLFGSVSYEAAAATLRSSQMGQNLLPRSDSASISDYATNANVTAAAYTWPGGPGLTNAITFGDNSATRYAAKIVSVTAGVTYTFSAYVVMDDLGPPVVGAAGLGTDFFPLVAVAVTSGAVVTRIGASNVYRVSYTWTAGATTAINLGIQKLASPNTGPRTFKTSGYQLVIGTKPGAYNPTLASALNTTYVPYGPSLANTKGQNLMVGSEALGNSGVWTPSHVTTAANTTETQDPWGTFTATKIVEDATTNMHYLTRGVTAAISDTYTFSLYLKNGNRRYASFYLNDLTNSHQATFDLQLGAVKNVGSGVSASIISAGNGWYRCIVVPKTVPGAAPAVYVFTSNSSGPYGAYAGDGTSYIYAVGAQAVKGLSPGAYNHTVATAINTTYSPTGLRVSSQQLSLRGLKLWLRADRGVTVTNGAVSTWADSSANHNDLVQTTASLRPTLVVGQNGKPAVRFDGVDDYLQRAFTSVQPETVFIVYKQLALGAWPLHDIIFDGVGGAGVCGLLSDTTPQSYIYAGSYFTVTPAIASGTYVYSALQFNGASSYIRVNGSQLNAGNVGAANPNGFTLGASGLGTRSTNIEVAEVIILSVVPTAAEVSSVETYLKERYAL